MRTILASLCFSSRRYSRIASLLTTLPLFLVALLLIVPSSSKCQTSAHYQIQPVDFLRAPDSLNATSFSYLLQFMFDNRGTMLIPDWKRARLLRFNEQGEFVSTVPLKKAGGDDTLQRAFLVNLSPEGLTYALEPAVTKRVLVLDQSGALKEETSYESKDFGIWDYAFVGEHRIAASINELSVFPGQRLERRYSVALVNLLNWSRITVRRAAPREGGDFSEDFTNIVSNAEGRFYVGLTSEKEYRIFIHDRNGATIRTITRNYVPIRKKSADIARESGNQQRAKLIAQKLGLKEITSNRMDRYHFAINWIALDSYDNLWVFTGKGLNDGVLSVDLFDENGDFRKSFFLENKELGNQRHANIRVRKNYLYAIVGDGNELDQHIFRYELPNELWR